MYNIIQLNDKNLSELQTIAQELGIKKTDSLKKEELVYKILDEQAIAGATKKVAADKLKEERKGEKQKRSRVTIKTVKKEGADKVFSANKNGIKVYSYCFIIPGMMNNNDHKNVYRSLKNIVFTAFLYPLSKV